MVAGAAFEAQLSAPDVVATQDRPAAQRARHDAPPFLGREGLWPSDGSFRVAPVLGPPIGARTLPRLLGVLQKRLRMISRETDLRRTGSETATPVRLTLENGS